MLDRKITKYIHELFGQEDEILVEVRQSIRQYELPEINIEPEEGQMLQLLLRMVGTRRAVEIGTLAGYSAICMARALPEDGKLYTIEQDKMRAYIADENLRYAGLSERVEVKLGEATDMLAELEVESPFDAVFIDADKVGYPVYMRWALDNVRVGGIVMAHNAFRSGAVVDPNEISDAGVRAVRETTKMLADDERVQASIIPIGDGLLVGVLTG